MTTRDTFVTRAETAEERSLERTAAWAIVAAASLVTLLGPLLTLL